MVHRAGEEWPTNGRSVDGAVIVEIVYYSIKQSDEQTFK